MGIYLDINGGTYAEPATSLTLNQSPLHPESFILNFLKLIDYSFLTVLDVQKN